MVSPQKRNKQRGYELEKAAEAELRKVFWHLARTGSVNYKHSAPDLAQVTENHPILLVVTRDRRRQMLVTLSAADFVDLTLGAVPWPPTVYVQCKSRETTWIGSLYEELKRAVKAL